MKNILVSISLLLMVALIAVACRGGEVTVAPTPTPTPTPTSTPTPVRFAVTLEEAEWVIGEFGNATLGAILIIRNKGTQTLGRFDWEIRATDQDGVLGQIVNVRGETSYTKGSLASDILPGEALRETVIAVFDTTPTEVTLKFTYEPYATDLLVTVIIPGPR